MKNTYIVRKAVEAKNIEEAIKKEKNAPILDIVLSTSNSEEQLIPAIGFAPDHTKEKND